MARLSVNINKVALLRNARGANLPDLLQVARDCERFGAQGITVHPRPDERHIRYSDVLELSPIVTTEFNIEGYPTDKFLSLVLQVKPAQCTLVPDAPDALTSNRGWDTLSHHSFLKEVISSLKSSGIRVSLFMEPVNEMIDGAIEAGADRIEFYTGPYAYDYAKGRENAIDPFIRAAEHANNAGIGINAGHDLNLDNLEYFAKKIPNLLEVSIGHALISDALYYGLQNTIQMYLRKLQMANW